MSLAQNSSPLVLPQGLQQQLARFRRTVWTIKSIEAIAGTICGLVVAWLLGFAVDRLWEPPTWVRYAIGAGAVAVCTWLPIALHRWIWRHRRLEQVARLISRRFPSLGDQMLGVIELVRNQDEQSRSRALCAAAIEQVAADSAKRDLSLAIPRPRHREWAGLAILLVGSLAGLCAIFPAAVWNAAARYFLPWQETARFTFTRVEPLANPLIVPHGEATPLELQLLANTQRRPEQAALVIGSQPAITSPRTDSSFVATLPPQLDESQLRVQIGDWQQSTILKPMLRPEVQSIASEIDLPEYLQRTEPVRKDLRSGSVTAVSGSSVRLIATATRSLQAAMLNEAPQSIHGAEIRCVAIPALTPQRLELTWIDEYGLSGREAFPIRLEVRNDEAPTLGVEDLPRQKIVLDTDVLTFKIRAFDDFGVKHVGMEWQTAEGSEAAVPIQGEKLLSAGGPTQERLEIAGTFSAKALKIPAQPLTVRLFVEDYLPGRERVYSPAATLFVLTAEQHAIWVTEQLGKWHRQSLDVRDREMQLHETNKELRELPPEELQKPENRKRLEAQASSERANSRRLSALVGQGENLVREASRNPEFGVGHLETWAEMLQILKDISANRMPTVADLLKQSAQQAASSSGPPTAPRPGAGQIRALPQGGGGAPTLQDGRPKPIVPTVSDVESSQNGAPKSGEQGTSPPQQAKSGSKLGLPTTSVLGGKPGKKGNSPPPATAAESLDEAVQQQADLLAEFDRIADELNKVLANLEGTTLVKRLKAAARLQDKVAVRMGTTIQQTFGQKPDRIVDPTRGILQELSEQETKSSQNLSNIMDDLEAYYERRPFQKFQRVLEEMKQQDPVGQLRQLADELPREHGITMSIAEFWSDTFDRWAEDLVDPGCSGKCPGCKSKGMLPPSMILEAMRILEAEMKLREETRVAEQAKAAIPTAEYQSEAGRLSGDQQSLTDRVVKLGAAIRELPDAEADFGYELKLLAEVETAMDEATGILASPDTGRKAIGAETEAIEAFLRSKRFNPKGGGGGGGRNPGGGGGGTTNDSALALLGTGTNDKEVREDLGTSQATGETGQQLPEEFRAGLSEYFNQLDPGRPTDSGTN